MEYKLNFKKYSAALKENNLLGLKCSNCETITCPPKMTCQTCAGTDLEIVELSGNGKIMTFTKVNLAPLDREEEVPYTIVMVELEEGPWIMGNLLDIDSVKIGMDLIEKKVKLGNKLFPGDRYSDGEAARPMFSLLR